MGGMKDAQFRWDAGEGRKSATTEEFIEELAGASRLWESGIWPL